MSRRLSSALEGIRKMGRVLSMAGRGAATCAVLLFGLGILESAVLFVKRPEPLSTDLALRLVWSPLLLGAIGAAFGVVVAAVAALALARVRSTRADGAAVWALGLPAILGFYWVFAANRVYPGSSRDPVALALDALAAVAGLILAGILWRAAVVSRVGGRRRVRWTLALVLVLWLPLYALSGEPMLERTRVSAPEAPAPAPAKGARNLVLVMLDTVRADCLSCYGPAEFPTPNIDRLAAESTLFEQAVTPEPLTRPAVCTMFTGLYPRTHGVDTNTKALSTDFPTLAEILRSHGYATAAFTAASVLSGEYGTAQGFDYYYEPSEPWWYLRSDFAARRLYISLTSWGNWWVEVPAREITARAASWLRRHRDRPFLLFVHYFDAHAPYDPLPEYDLALREGLGTVQAPYDDEQVRFSPDFVMPPAFLRQEWLRYSGEIAHVDESVGELIDFLDRSGLSDSTVVVLLTDHGESFEHAAYFSHGTRLYDPQVHVAFMVRDPARPRASRLRGQVRLTDVLPTLLSLLGFSPPAPVQGVDLVPRMDGRAPDDDLPGFCQTDLEDRRPLSGRASHALRLPPWKYIESPGEGLVELYDLAADPGETLNVAVEASDVQARLADALAEWMESTETLELDPVELTPEAREALRALGYVQ